MRTQTVYLSLLTRLSTPHSKTQNAFKPEATQYQGCSFANRFSATGTLVPGKAFRTCSSNAMDLRNNMPTQNRHYYTIHQLNYANNTFSN